MDMSGGNATIYMSAEIGPCFVDTNVLVYAHDRTAGDKGTRARELVQELWRSGEGCLSVQVLQELFVTLTRKVPRPLGVDEAAVVVSDFSAWRTHAPNSADVVAAIDIHRLSRISFWDAMIVRSAAKLVCPVLYSEDLDDGQVYEGVSVVDPFS